MVVGLLVAVAIVAIFAVVAVRDDDSPDTAGAGTTVPETSSTTTTVVPTTSVAPSTAPAVSTAPIATVPPAPGGDFVAVTPARLIDTRTGLGMAGAKVGKAPLVTASVAGRTGTRSGCATRADG